MKLSLFGLVFALLLGFRSEARTIRIAVIDTGIMLVQNEEIKLCADGHADMTGTGMFDRSGHGTNIAYTIARNLKGTDYCLIIIKAFDPTLKHQMIMPDLLALVRALNLKDLDVVNFSAGGSDSLIAEKFLVSGFIDRGVKFVAAAGNEALNLDKNCNYFPACYKGVISVGNYAAPGIKHPTTNYGKTITAWEVGTNVCAAGICLTGTSQATAIHTAKIVRELQAKKK